MGKRNRLFYFDDDNFIYLLFFIFIVLPYGYNQNYGFPNGATGGAVGGRFPQANGAANSAGYGPSINGIKLH